MWLIVSALLFALEWGLKTAVRRSSKLPRLCLGGLVKLCYCQNRGMAMGALRKSPWLAKMIPLVAAVLLTVLWGLFGAPFSPGAESFAVSVLLAGAWNNVLDRLVHGFVTDYLCFPRACVKRLRTVVFNLADIYLFFGTAFALILSFFGEFF